MEGGKGRRETACTSELTIRPGSLSALFRPLQANDLSHCSEVIVSSEERVPPTQYAQQDDPGRPHVHCCGLVGTLE